MKKSPLQLIKNRNKEVQIFDNQRKCWAKLTEENVNLALKNEPLDIREVLEGRTRKDILHTYGLIIEDEDAEYERRLMRALEKENGNK